MKKSEKYFTELLPSALEGHETRPEQISMSAAVEKALEASRHLVVEAGTGTGKSLAYLVPALIHTLERKTKLVVSTYTKILQSQLVEKDIPFVRDLLSRDGINFGYCVFYGGENYLCLRKLEKFFSSLAGASDLARRLAEFARASASGLLGEFDFGKDADVRYEICRESDLCLGSKCRRQSECFYRKACARAASSDLIVVNHHLLFTNLASGGRVLPGFGAVVCDEAHDLEEVAMDLLGEQLSNFQVRRLCDDICGRGRARGLIGRLKRVPSALSQELEKAVACALASSGEMFAELASAPPAEKDTLRFRSPPAIPQEIVADFKNLAAIVGQLSDHADSDEELIEIKSRHRRAAGAAAVIDMWLNHKRDDAVYWLERTRLRRGTRVTISATPFDVGKTLSKEFFGKLDSAILTSATLSVGGNFDYFKKSVGLDGCDELILESSFDYPANVMLYVPAHLPDPKAAPRDYENAVKNEVESVVKLTAGRAFVLFTSYRMLDMIHSEMEKLARHHLLKQGVASNYKIIEDFKTTENAVLFGTDSFWQGVDVPGEALICVIITRLPFDVPDHPVVESKVEKIAASGFDPFSQYTLPKAILKFRQGFGRLMRSSSDWGVVAVLDPRVRTRYYGRYFLAAVPKTRMTDDIAAVAKFVASRAEDNPGGGVRRRLGGSSDGAAADESVEPGGSAHL